MTVLLENRRATFDYEILEKFNAGIELTGGEVKNLRLKQGSLKGGRVVIRGGEAYLLNIGIPTYQPGNSAGDYDERRTRRLLLTKRELAKLSGAEGKNGLTIVPTLVYNSGRYIKLEIAVVRAKKKFDKRQTIRKRETEREIRRTLKNR
jgi:SsrA-binding protein